MTSTEIRSKFLEFFKARGHTIVPSSSLIPNDPSVLLTTAGMQQFKPYYSNPTAADTDFGSRNTVSIQKSFRTSDIEEVGDERHLTFFEMLGNFSFGGYFKKEAIAYAHEFITKEMGLEISYVTIFTGSHGVPKDEESRSIWQLLGVTKIEEQGMEDVFWGPTGSGGPCGPTTEIYCKNGAGQDIEVWNIVFNEFVSNSSREDLLVGKAKLTELPQKGIDTGMGLERLAMISQGVKTVFDTDLFKPLIDILPANIDSEVHKRIIVDHIRGSVFLLVDGVRPSNKEVGYVLRRLLRRMFVYEHKYKISEHIFDELTHGIIKEYGKFYPELLREDDIVRKEIKKEHDGFKVTLGKGIKELEKIEEMDGRKAFNLFQSYGLSPETTFEIKPFDFKEFNQAKAEHLAVSGMGQEKKFGGHGLLLDTGELKAGNEEELKKVTRLHTATHLLQAALRKVLGEEVHQMGSDITPERTRFDFSFPRKVTPDELKEVEKIVNKAIEHDYIMEAKKMPYEEATKTGALYFFKEKYPEEVNVYSVHDPKSGEVFSREFCGGPHVSHTGEIGLFKILKEEASSAGVRRIRATVR